MFVFAFAPADALAQRKPQPANSYDPAHKVEDHDFAVDAEILWAVDVIAPAFRLENDQLAGYGAQAVDWFIDRIAHHPIKLTSLPRGRAFDIMRHASATNDRTVCMPGLLETEARAREFIISNTVLSQFPVSVIVRADHADAFAPFMNDAGEIDLVRLLLDRQFDAALESGRSYGELVDDILREYGFGEHVQKTRQSADFITMLTLERIDWFLAYPIEAEHHRLAANHPAMIKSLPIEGMPDFLDAKIICSTTDAGYHVIEHTNAIIAEMPDMPWATGYIDLLSPDDAKRYQELIKNRQARNIRAGN